VGIINHNYTAGDVQIFNADCMARHLVESIFRRCQCKSSGEKEILLNCIAHFHFHLIDQLAVVDEGCKEIINVSRMSTSVRNGCDLFQDRGVYVLLAVSSGEHAITPHVPYTQYTTIYPSNKCLVSFGGGVHEVIFQASL
jgi:hypothetical protein